MHDLIGFELRKILSRRVTFFTSIGVIVLLCIIMALNIVQTRPGSSTAPELEGTEAIAYNRALDDAHVGILTDERVEADLEHYRAIAFEKVAPEDLVGISGSDAFSMLSRAYDAGRMEELYEPYYRYLLAPWRMSGEEPAQTVARLEAGAGLGFYDELDRGFQEKLDHNSAWTYTDAEKAFWTEKRAEVPEPVVFGFTDGWEDIIDCLAFLVFAMLAVCVALTPMFASEYLDRTDSIILATKHGRGRLLVAKIAAAFIYATVFYVICAGIIVVVPLMFYGTGGGDLPLQAVSLLAPYGLTVAQATFLGIGIGYLMTLAFAGLTLMMSARTASTLAIYVVDVALILVLGLLPSGGMQALVHLSFLCPLNALAMGALYTLGTSYALGGIVLDLPVMLVMLYGIVLLASVPLAARSFRRHQVC